MGVLWAEMCLPLPPKKNSDVKTLLPASQKITIFGDTALKR